MRHDEHVAPDERRSNRDLATYEGDPYTWAKQQAALLRAGDWTSLDVVNLADEVEDVAGREHDKAESALAVVIHHIVKWDFQPERRSRSWVLTIAEHRRRVSRVLRENPGLKRQLGEIFIEASASGRYEALRETGLDPASVPTQPLASFDEAMTRPISWPEP